MPTNALAMINDDEMPLGDVLAARAAAVLGGITGAKLKFVKGDFFLDNIKVDDISHEYYAELGGIISGWEKWTDKQIVSTIFAGVRENLPPRSSLDEYSDKSRWELGLDQKPKD